MKKNAMTQPDVHSPSLRALLRCACATLALGAATLIAPAALAADPAPANAAPQVKFETSQGAFTVEVYPDRAPKTVANFLQYVADKHYDGTIFHRVVPGFVVQGGGYTRDMAQKPTRAPVVNEAKNGLTNKRGTIAMARLPDPNSATSQFFVNTADNRALNFPSPDGYGYAVFGKVTEGMDVIDKIEAAPTGNAGGMQGVPVTPIIIERAYVVKPGASK
jgi:peptidyl-prolyl cis-trans isomerase A (cyclophilin A)